MRTSTVKYPLSVAMQDGQIISMSEHRELYDADDDLYDRSNLIESVTSILVSTCMSVNGGDKLSPKALRNMFLRMASPVRDYLFYAILEASDPHGVVVKELTCMNNSCGKRFKTRAIESVPTEEDEVVSDEDEVTFGPDENPGEDDDFYDNAFRLDSVSRGEIIIDRSEWRMLESEKEFTLYDPVEVQVRPRGKKDIEFYTVESLRLRVQNGHDEEFVSRFVKTLSLVEIGRKLRSRRIMSAGGLPDEYVAKIQNTNFIRQMTKADQTMISSWDMENSVLKPWQFSKCPHCGEVNPHLRDPGFFF